MNSRSSYSDPYATLSQFVEQSARLSLDMMRSYTNTGSSLGSMMPTVRGCNCGCGEIPAPCWMPQELCEVTSHVCPGGTASVRIRVTNCTMTNRVVHLQAAGAHAADVKFNPATLTLGPMERDFAVASFATPPKAGHGEEWEVLLWVRGCRDHYLRWTIKANDRGQDSCHEVEVDDCPDLVHHWYDHFYCDRACTHPR